MNEILITNVTVDKRVRTDLGDIDGLCNSVKKYGLIQPIVLGLADDPLKPQPEKPNVVLVAGGRRLTALKRLGYKVLTHGVEFIWQDETYGTGALHFRAIELEENLKRKELTWQEQLVGKQRLLELMQEIHGAPTFGRPTNVPSATPGFGVNKLAAMLGESPATVSNDLSLAKAIAQLPTLGHLKNKSEALTQLKILGAVVSMQQAAPQNRANTTTQRSWVLHEVDFRAVPSAVASDSVDLIWTDLPYGADVNTMSGQAATALAGFDDSVETARSLLDDIARHSFRVLRNNRYAVFCFGFVLYTELCLALSNAGFAVNPVPFIWAKNTKSGENPTSRYCNAYEPLLVAAKGNPVFIRPGMSNVATIDVVQSKLQSVQKPTELIKRFIWDMTAEDAVVVDFCAGTGTTGVACHETKRNAVLFERDSRMSTIARARLEALK